MERARLYLDEDVYHAVAVGLRRRGFDVLTTSEAGRCGSSDEDQLGFAASQRRVLFTFNRGDFARLHAESLTAGRHHRGIIVSLQAEIGPVIRALARLLSESDAAGLMDRLVWLPLRDPGTGAR